MAESSESDPTSLERKDFAMTKSVILVTGASSGFGLMTARALAEAGHTVYASMRDTQGRNAPQVVAVAEWAAERKADLRTVELDVQSDASSEAAVAHSGAPADTVRAAEYENGPYLGITDKALKGLASLEPADADPADVAREIVRVVDRLFGKRPFRVHVDPSQDGAEVVNAVADRMRLELYRNIDLETLLRPRII
jgi:NAD(P)-dependent dehydrogenase (short-subunit alcohol dehydrogenase family)